MKKGFTLLELSIVLVIIGLIIGGVTAGQDLIRAAELNAVNNQINQYRVAINTFKLKYNQLPGDMTNAQSYWPSCVDNGVNTCNGDGDGVVIFGSEGYRFWQHLSLAGLIAGSYNGQQVITSLEDYYPFILNSQLITDYKASYGDKTDVTRYLRKQRFYQDFSSTEIDELKMIQLDTKFDDGMPESGEIQLIIEDGSASACLTATSPADYDYTASGDYNECYPSFMWN